MPALLQCRGITWPGLFTSPLVQNRSSRQIIRSRGRALTALRMLSAPFSHIYLGLTQRSVLEFLMPEGGQGLIAVDHRSATLPVTPRIHAGPPQRSRGGPATPTLSEVPEVAKLLATILTGEPVTHGAVAVIPLLAPNLDDP